MSEPKFTLKTADYMVEKLELKPGDIVLINPPPHESHRSIERAMLIFAKAMKLAEIKCVAAIAIGPQWKITITREEAKPTN